MKLFPRKSIHLDYAATTPMDSQVFLKMKPYFVDEFHNPSSLYDEGRTIKNSIEKSRTFVAKYLGSRPEEVYFTSGGTESSNLAIRGVMQAFWSKDPTAKAHLITTEFEHPATLEVCKFMEAKGWVEITYLTPNTDGVITAQMVADSLREDTILVSIIHVHNEVGTVQPIRAISRKIKEFKKKKDTDTNRQYPYLHTDSSQALCYLKVHKESLGADLITLDSSKFYGPKGVGALFVKGDVEIEAVTQGGGQERGLRPGTENTPGIVGFTEALRITEDKRTQETERLILLRDFFEKEVKSYFSEAIIHGSDSERTPHIVNVCFPGIDSEFLTIQLASRKINVSFMTACKTSGDDNFSHSLQAINPECSKSSIRFSFGRKTTKKELLHSINILKDLIKK